MRLFPLFRSEGRIFLFATYLVHLASVLDLLLFDTLALFSILVPVAH